MRADLLLPLYLVVFIRQYLWSIDYAALAWTLTALVALILWGFHLRFENDLGEKTPALFWLVVALPLFLIYASRIAFPDISFDVLNHRLVQSERALRGFLFIQGDFFHTLLPFNPASEMLGGVFRHLLGYRAGTIISYLALLWTGTEVEKLLRPLSGKLLRCAAVLFVLFTEYLLFEINNYVGDLLSLPLMLAATRRTLEFDRAQSKSYEALFIGFLLGASIAFKLTNSVVVFPVLLLYGRNLILGTNGIATKRAILMLLSGFVAFVAPLVPHGLYIYQHTKSPVFPLYNRLIGSPYWPLINIADGRWGPQTTFQTFLWPLISFFKPERLSEIGVYSGRLSFGFIAALVGLLIVRNDARLRWLCLFTLSGSILWSATSGYIRYALYIEVLAGVTVIGLSRYLVRFLNIPKLKRITIALIGGGLLASQAVRAAKYISLYEWSMRPTVITQPAEYFSEISFLLRDRALMKFQYPENIALLENVQTWIVSDVKTNGVEIMLKPRIPILAVHNDIYFQMPASRQAFTQALARVAGTRMYSLAYTDNLNNALGAIRRRGLTTGNMNPVKINYFSRFAQLPLTLIEVIPRTNRSIAEQVKDLAANPVLPDDGYTARLTSSQPLFAMHAGQRETITVKVKNASESVWLALGDSEGRHPINLRNRWLDAQTGDLINEQDGGKTLPRNLLPGEEVEVSLTITAPPKAGQYILEFDLVQEQITWFHQMGSETLSYRIKVE